MNIYPHKQLINKHHKFCCYLTMTIYYGKLLPPFYIGSTSVKKINNGYNGYNGYNGSVSSKKNGKKYMIKRKKENPHLFKTKILRPTSNNIERHNTTNWTIERKNK